MHGEQRDRIPLNESDGAEERGEGRQEGRRRERAEAFQYKSDLSS